MTHRARGSVLAGASGGRYVSLQTAPREAWQRVGIGELAASASPAVLHAVLGSCVSVCLYDPVEKIGGINHILISSAHPDCCFAARCGIQAMELLINAMMNLGADRRRFVAKAFGGANVLPNFKPPTVGELNARFVRKFLVTEKIPLLAERLGGTDAVRLSFDTGNGRARVHTVSGVKLPEIVREEDTYYHTDIADRFHIEEPTIF
jgi:chemotaxis protein CheD